MNLSEKLKRQVPALFLRLIPILFCSFFIAPVAKGQLKPVTLTIRLRGVYQSNVILLPFKNGRWQDNSRYHATAYDGSSVSFTVDSADLPGEFVIRYNYKAKQGDGAYPSEQSIFIGNQSISIDVHPVYSSNTDSTRFEDNELENNLWRRFNAEKGKRMQQVQLLQQVLMGYDNIYSPMYASVKAEYGRKAKAFNNWLTDWEKQYTGNYVASLFQFSRIEDADFSGSTTKRFGSLITNYYKGLSFNNPGLVRTAEFTNWLTTYVNLQAEMAKTQPQLDSILKAAAINMIEAVRKGDPLVYGYVVDYFFDGFERNNMPQAVSILEPYLTDPACLTRKQQAIKKRLSGLRYMKPGVQLNGVLTERIDGRELFTPLVNDTATMPTLVVFYYSDCGHCTSFLKELKDWYGESNNRSKLRVMSICVDDNKERWKMYAQTVKFGWTDGYASGGINSEAAADYYVLSTPALFLCNASGHLLSMPEGMKQIIETLQ